MSKDAQKLVQEIVAGRRDADLDDIASAIAVRVKDTMSTFAWRFRLDDVDVNELEVTLLEWSDIQKHAGVHLVAIQPERNVDHLLAIGRVLLRSRAGLTDDEALARVGALAAPDVLEVVTREIVSAPKDSAPPAST